MLILKNLELVSTDGKNPLFKQQKSTQLSFQDIKDKVSVFEENLNELKENVNHTNQLLEEIRDILSSGQIYTSINNQNINTNQKMYIPDPEFNTSKTSSKKTKDTISDSDDLTDTLKSLTEITGGKNEDNWS